MTAIILIILIIIIFVVLIKSSSGSANQWNSDNINIDITKYYDHGKPEQIRIHTDSEKLYIGNNFILFDNIIKATTQSITNRHRIRGASPYLSNPYRETTINYLTIYYKSIQFDQETNEQFYSGRSIDKLLYSQLASYINKRIHYKPIISDKTTPNEL